jgi:hypothetical protein
LLCQFSSLKSNRYNSPLRRLVCRTR